MTDIASLEQKIAAEIAGAADEAALEAVRVSALGKSGSVTALLKTLGGMSPDERKVQGPAINGLRDRVNTALNARREGFKGAFDTRLDRAVLGLERRGQQNHGEYGKNDASKHQTILAARADLRRLAGLDQVDAGRPQPVQF